MQGRERKRRIRPVEAFSAMKVLLRDKEDTAQVFRIVEALAGNSYYHHFRRFAESEGGRRILASRSNLLEHLRDRERLARCPIGSLGQRYLAFVYGEGLSADGLVEASKRSEEHTSELQSLMRISYAVFCLKKKKRYTK